MDTTSASASGQGPAPGSDGVGAALGSLATAMQVLAGVEYADLPAPALGEVLLALERADAAGTVARGRALNAFDAKDGHEDDAQRTAGAWLVHVARVMCGS